MRHPDDRLHALARLHDDARERAHDLRRQAVSEWVSDLGHALDQAADHAGRAARRWAQRLGHHRRQRPGAGPTLEG